MHGSLAAQPVAQPPDPDPAADSGSEVIEVQDTTSHATLMERSAEAVHVVETAQAKHQTADLGEVLARTPGIAIRRSAGLGSDARFALDGLYDDQIRFFLDGLPLAIAGFPFGVEDVPVNLIDRVEIYRGVVPIRFGADALGGAINLVSAKPSGSRAGASYELGSFGTHRATVSARHDDTDTGLSQSATAFLDHATNDYRVHAVVADARGRTTTVSVPRFHDGYDAAGAELELGVHDRRWADRLTVRGYYTGYDKDLQSNAIMAVPYGAVRYGERVGGASARYQVALPFELRLDAVAAYAHRRITFLDVSTTSYDWYGNPTATHRTGGEIDGTPYDNIYRENDGFARVLLSRPLPLGELRLSISPQYTERTGANRARLDTTTRDPLSAAHSRLAVISGLEWEVDPFDDDLENIVFAKSYLYRAAFEDARPGGIFVTRSLSHATFGAGDALRWRPRRWLYLKASYEYATRLPTADELFGNGVLVGPNPQLAPEVSHNVNLGPRFELSHPRAGTLALDVSAFWRDSQKLIYLLGKSQFLSYQNVYDARSLGVDAAGDWSAPGRWITLEGSISYQDQRNASSSGTFGAFNGDRIPNRPWLFASYGVHGRYEPPVGLASGVVEPFYVARYVHAFSRGWESLGAPSAESTVRPQLSHDVGVTYSGRAGATQLSATFEIDNLGDARLYDSFGAQRPGRGYYLKLTGEL